MNIKLFRIPAFAITNIQLFALGFILMSSSQLLPQMAQEVMGYDALTSGLTLAVAGGLTILLMPVAGIVTGRFVQPKYLVIMAFGGTALSMWVASGLNLKAGFWDISHIRMLQAIWLPFLFIPLISMGVAKIPPQLSNDASAINNLTRNIGGSFGISFTTTLLAYRGQFHHARLAEHITPYNGYGAGASLLAIEHRVQMQTTMLSYIDVYAMIGGLSLLAMALAVFLPRMPKGAMSVH